MNPIDALLNFFVSAFRPLGSSDEPAPEPPDRISGVPGLHLLSDYGSGHELRTSAPTEAKITALMNSLDWDFSFYQVVLVRPEGDSMEVGGSLDPSDGLSSLYRNDADGIYRVVDVPPATVQEMTDLLLSFHRGDNRWKTVFDRKPA